MMPLQLRYAAHKIDVPLAPRHEKRLSFHNLVFLVKGHLEYEVNGRALLLCPGDALFIPEGSHRVRKPPQEEIDHFVFNFHCDEPIRLPPHMPDALHGEVFALLAAYDAIHKNALCDTSKKDVCLLCCLLETLQDRVLLQAYDPLTRTILDYLHKHFAQKITLAEIGQLTFFSPIYCDTVFKRDTGSPIIDYLLELRIEEAKRLLLQRERSVREVAEAVGFSDCNYFSRVFKKRSGYTPSAYRKNT